VRICGLIELAEHRAQKRAVVNTVMISGLIMQVIFRPLIDTVPWRRADT
jgi:hypothetical protein